MCAAPRRAALHSLCRAQEKAEAAEAASVAAVAAVAALEAEREQREAEEKARVESELAAAAGRRLPRSLNWIAFFIE